MTTTTIPFKEIWTLRRIGVDNYPIYEFQLDKGGSILIGKCKEADIRCASNFVSREHCKIVRCRCQNGRDLSVYDYGSFNGTFLSESKLPTCNARHLKHGSRLGIGLPSTIVEKLRDDIDKTDEIEKYFAFVVEKKEEVNQVGQAAEPGYIFGLRSQTDKTSSFLELLEINADTMDNSIVHIKCEFGSAMTAQCKLKYKSNSFQIFDLGLDSKTGKTCKTYLNKMKIPSTGLYLKNGDEIEFGPFDVNQGCQAHRFKFIFTDKGSVSHSTSENHELELAVAGPSKATSAPKIYVCKRIVVKKNSTAAADQQASRKLKLPHVDKGNANEHVQTPMEVQGQTPTVIPPESDEPMALAEPVVYEEMDESNFFLPRELRRKLIAETTNKLAKCGMTMEDFARIVVQSIDYKRLNANAPNNGGGGGGEPSGTTGCGDKHKGDKVNK